MLRVAGVLLFAVCAGVACTTLDEGHGGDAGDHPDADASTGASGGSGGSAGGKHDGGSPERDAGRRPDASAPADSGSSNMPAADAATATAADSGSAVDSGAALDSGVVVVPPRCGDAHVDPGEDCDDGAATVTCTADCATPIVIPPGCGDAHVDPGEDCDDGAESATCNADCTTVSCGDHKRNATAGEACDGGGETATCNADCSAVSCGDHKRNATAGEDCDDGGESATCNADCTTVSCGDHKRNATAGEDCDDGGESATCNADCTTQSCGDGKRNATAGEQCDGAGETASCNADCTTVSCGDNQTNATSGEECDDGKDGDDGDGCTDSCAWSCVVDDDCAVAYGGRCSNHACVPRTFGMPASLMTVAGLHDTALAMDGHGNALVVWESDASLYHAWYSPDGGWGAASVLVANGKFPQLGSDGRGNMLLAYSASDPVTAKLEHVRMRRYRPGVGTPVPDPSGWRNEYTVKSYTNYVALGTDWITPAIGIGTNGDAYLAWRAQQQTGGGMGSSATWVARCDNSVDTCATATSIDSVARLMGNPQIAIDSTGSYPLVTWSISANTGETSVIRGARYETSWSVTDAATATWPDRVTNNTLVADGTGQGWLPITRLIGGALSGSVLRNRQPSLAAAFAWDTPLASPRSLALDLAANSTGDLIATTFQLTDSNTKLVFTGAALKAGSQTWSSETPLASYAFDPSAVTPNLALDGYGHGFALWVNKNGAQAAVSMTRFLRTTTVSWSPPADVSPRTTDTLSGVQAAVEADGRGVAGWLEDNGSQVTLWVSAFK